MKDMQIFRQELTQLLSENAWILTGDGYPDQSLLRLKNCHMSEKTFFMRVRSRHETVNGMLKQLNSLNIQFWHEVEKTKLVLKQLQISESCLFCKNCIFFLFKGVLRKVCEQFRLTLSCQDFAWSWTWWKWVAIWCIELSSSQKLLCVWRLFKSSFVHKLFPNLRLSVFYHKNWRINIKYEHYAMKFQSLSKRG